MSILSFTKKTKEDPGHKSRLKRMNRELEAGFRFLSEFDCDKVVTIFGSAISKKNSLEYKQSRELARRLSETGITILTGGGPGIMEAANRGAYDAGGRSAGLNIHLDDEERKNFYVVESAGFHYFFARKIMLAYAAQGYCFFPGGFGTMDEFYEISTLIKTKKMTRQLPMVLIGVSFWQGLIDWMRQQMVDKHFTLEEKWLHTWTITDDLDEAFEILRKVPKDVPRCDVASYQDLKND